MPLYMNGNDVTYFDIFAVESISKETERCIGKNNIPTNIYRLDAYDSIMCGYYHGH